MFKYALRYVPLLLLAVILLSWRYNVTVEGRRNVYVRQESYQTRLAPSHFDPGASMYSLDKVGEEQVWAAGGVFVTEADRNDRSLLHIVGKKGQIYYNNGAQWVQQGQFTQPVLGIDMVGEKDGWAVGNQGFIAHFDGKRWGEVKVDFGQPIAFLSSIAMTSASDGWSVGANGLIMHYNGKKWEPVASPVTTHLNSIAMMSASEGWAVGDGGTIVEYRDGKWRKVDISQLTGATLQKISAVGKDEAWVVGNEGTILHYRGGEWEKVRWSLYYANKETVNIAANVGGITMNAQHSSGGRTPSDMNLMSIGMSSVHSGWIGSDNGIVVYQQENWVMVDGGQMGTVDWYNWLFRDIVMSKQEGWAVGCYQASDGGCVQLSIYHYKKDDKWVPAFIES